MSGKKVMRVVMRADQSPMNFRRWNLLLDCGARHLDNPRHAPAGARQQGALWRMCAGEEMNTKGPAPVWIDLTPDQAAALREHFAFVHAEAARGFKGMLVAQVMNYPGSQVLSPRMKVGFIPHERAKLLAKFRPDTPSARATRPRR